MNTTAAMPAQPPPSPPDGPRQRFPTRKQALVGCFGSLVLSFTTCTTVLVVFGERQVNDFEAFLIGLTVFICVVAPIVGFAILVMYFMRRRSNPRREDHTS